MNNENLTVGSLNLFSMRFKALKFKFMKSVARCCVKSGRKHWQKSLKRLTHKYGKAFSVFLLCWQVFNLVPCNHTQSYWLFSLYLVQTSCGF